MKYLLDTNICIYVVKKQPVAVLQKFLSFEPGEIGISAIVAAELQFGVQKSAYPERNERALAQFLLPLVVVPFDAAAAAAYGKLRAELQAQGQPIGSMDMLIAAQAIALDVTLVTNNTREFSRVSHLNVENWVGS